MEVEVGENFRSGFHGKFCCNFFHRYSIINDKASRWQLRLFYMAYYFFGCDARYGDKGISCRWYLGSFPKIFWYSVLTVFSAEISRFVLWKNAILLFWVYQIIAICVSFQFTVLNLKPVTLFMWNRAYDKQICHLYWYRVLNMIFISKIRKSI